MKTAWWNLINYQIDEFADEFDVLPNLMNCPDEIWFEYQIDVITDEINFDGTTRWN